MKIFRLSLLIALFVINQPAAFAQDKSTYKRDWEATESKMKTDPSLRDKFFISFTQPASSEEREAAQKFLLERVSNGVTDIEYYTAYSRLAWDVGASNRKSSTLNSSAVIAATAILLSQTDLARCSDKTPGTAMYVDTITRLKDPVQYIRSMDAKSRKQILDDAMKFEAKMETRPGNDYLCGPAKNGLSAYISDAQWRENRDRLRREFEPSFDVTQ